MKMVILAVIKKSVSRLFPDSSGSNAVPSQLVQDTRDSNGASSFDTCVQYLIGCSSVKFNKSINDRYL